MNAIKSIKIWFLRSWYLVLVALAIAVFSQWLLSPSSKIDPSLSPSNPSALITDTWQSVTIGGGGYITGIYPHPQEPNLIYARTDNGGCYRWHSRQQQWLPITDSLPATSWDYDHYGGSEALALDPQNSDLVYIAVGKYRDRPGTIFKSEDRGQTWQQSNLKIPMGGDEEKRWGGERLAVSPYDSQLLLFGSRQNGLWRSLDGGLTWTQMTGLPIADNVYGVMAIAFAPRSTAIYASVYDDGVYRSTDGGTSWQKLKHGPARVMQLQVAEDGVVYTTSDESPQVSRYGAGQWQDITPRGLLVHDTFNGLSLHPQQSDTLIVSEGEKGGAKIYYSSDRGASWSLKTARLDKTLPWLASEFFNDHNSAIAFDPQDPRQVWLTDWFSIWHTDDITASQVTWTNRIEGIEQTVLLTLAAPPEGALLLSGLADQEGFYHRDLHNYPATRLGFEPQGNYLGNLKLDGDRYLDNFFQDTFHIAYCQNHPLNLVRVGGQRWRDTYAGVTSSDGGITWQPWANIPQDQLFLRVAVDPNRPQHFVVTTSEDLPLVTFDGGSTWQEVAGLPRGEAGPWNWNQPIAADGVNGDRFYYFSQGKIYRSDDGGKTFRAIARGLPKGDNHILTTVPGKEGEFWLALDRGGLYHSSDSGSSLEQIDEITEAHLVAVGKTFDGAAHDSIIYVYGKLNGQSGLWVSADVGRHWQQVNRNSPMPKTTKVLVASQQQPGLIFAGTDGRGIYYYLSQKRPS